MRLHQQVRATHQHQPNRTALTMSHPSHFTAHERLTASRESAHQFNLTSKSDTLPGASSELLDAESDSGVKREALLLYLPSTPLETTPDNTFSVDELCSLVLGPVPTLGVHAVVVIDCVATPLDDDTDHACQYAAAWGYVQASDGSRARYRAPRTSSNAALAATADTQLLLSFYLRQALQGAAANKIHRGNSDDPSAITPASLFSYLSSAFAARHAISEEWRDERAFVGDVRLVDKVLVPKVERHDAKHRVVGVKKVLAHLGVRASADRHAPVWS